MDLVDKLPTEKGSAECFEVCAKFIPTTSEASDITRAQGPSTSTTAAQQELDTAEDREQWISLLEDDMEDIAEMTSLPALQGMLERMEALAGRVVANELLAKTEDGGYGARDEIGRERIRKVCVDFHQHCAKLNHEQELDNLMWRVQLINLEIKPESETSNTITATDEGGQRPARLRVPTSRKACSWWKPDFWSIARPTDFCYGDCVWGFLGEQPVPLSITDWLIMLLRREEMEYDVEGDEQKYEAAPINRFRSSWYDLHLFASFWRVTETTKSVHCWMKTPGAFGTARACAQMSVPMLEELYLKQQGSKTTVQSLLADKDLPQAMRSALLSIGQATASLVGSDGHRRLLHRENIAYTLRWGPPLVFSTPNLADNKQPLLLLVQGEEFQMSEHINHSYREMTERLAGDPVGQAIAFELMIMLFFTHVLGIQRETVGWKRGEARKFARHWNRNGSACNLEQPFILGPVAAAFGPVEAQGRGSLHPHILIWLLLAEIYDLVQLLLRDRAAMRSRLECWMLKLIESVASVQESSVAQLPRSMCPPESDAQPPFEVPPLPFGPNEKTNFMADGRAHDRCRTCLGDDRGVEQDH